jgi:hypothetical protein
MEREVFRAIHRADEWAAVQSGSAVLELNLDASEAMLQPVVVSGWPVIEAMLDGARGIEAITHAVDWPADRVLSTVLRLVNRDVIRVVSRAPEALPLRRLTPLSKASLGLAAGA